MIHNIEIKSMMDLIHFLIVNPEFSLNITKQKQQTKEDWVIMELYWAGSTSPSRCGFNLGATEESVWLHLNQVKNQMINQPINKLRSIHEPEYLTTKPLSNEAKEMYDKMVEQIKPKTLGEMGYLKPIEIEGETYYQFIKIPIVINTPGNNVLCDMLEKGRSLENVQR